MSYYMTTLLDLKYYYLQLESHHMVKMIDKMIALEMSQMEKK